MAEGAEHYRTVGWVLVGMSLLSLATALGINWTVGPDFGFIKPAGAAFIAAIEAALGLYLLRKGARLEPGAQHARKHPDSTVGS